MRRLAILAALLVASVGGARAERLTISLSTSEIMIDSTFTGATVTLFGVIERDALTVSRATGYQIAVVLRGPPQTVIARRKDRLALIWVNNASETILGAPALYALNTSAPIAEDPTDPLLARYEIGFDNLQFTFENQARASDPMAVEFRNAFIRLKEKEGLYTERPDGVSFIGGNQTVFQSGMWVPANAPDGHYTVQVYLFSGHVLLAREEGALNITKAGAEQVLYAAANDHAFFYGLACVALALFTGWLGGVVFRRD